MVNCEFLDLSPILYLLTGLCCKLFMSDKKPKTTFKCLLVFKSNSGFDMTSSIGVVILQQPRQTFEMFLILFISCGLFLQTVSGIKDNSI